MKCFKNCSDLGHRHTSSFMILSKIVCSTVAVLNSELQSITFHSLSRESTHHKSRLKHVANFISDYSPIRGSLTPNIVASTSMLPLTLGTRSLLRKLREASSSHSGTLCVVRRPYACSHITRHILIFQDGCRYVKWDICMPDKPVKTQKFNVRRYDSTSLVLDNKAINAQVESLLRQMSLDRSTDFASEV